MKMPCFLSILCLISAVTAGPGWPAVIEVREGPSYPRHLLLPSHFDTQDTTSSVFTHEGDDLGNTDDEGVQRDVVMDGGSSSSGGNRPSVVIRGIQEQLMEDLLRMEQDLLLIRRLLGQGHLSFPHSDRRPLVQSPSSSPPWSFPVLPPVHNPWWTEEEEEEEDEDEDDYFEDPISGQDSPWFNFPALGFNRPIFPDIPAVPSGGDGGETPSFHDLPDNYDNSTHNVHVVNGSRVEVNTTTNKKTGDGFNSFFHHQVIHIRPDQDTIGEVPTEEGEVPVEGEVTVEGEGEVLVEEEGEVPVEEGEVPVEGEGEVPAEGEGEVPAEGEGEVPVEEDTFTIFPTSDIPEEVTGPVDRVLPQLPEVENEVSGNSRQVTETPTRPEEVKEGWEKGVRVLRGADDADDTLPEPKTSAYVINSIQRESYDDDDDDDEVEEPDLSGDTRVNHVRPKGKKGVSMMEPEAEIFNRKLVLKEAKTTTK